VAAGTYTFVGKATNEQGLTGTSEPITITVEPGGEPGSLGTQEVHLHEGWNLISTKRAPDATRLDLFFSDVLDHIQVVKDGEGNIFQPGDDINTIGHWNPLEAYMVHSTTEQWFTVEGKALHPEWTPLILEPGWNIVTYLPDESLPVGEAMQSISELLVLVKDFEGNAYIPEFGVNEIGDLEPGQGYKVFVSGEATLTYPRAGKSTMSLKTSDRTTGDKSGR